jgi:hypothetical protein
MKRTRKIKGPFVPLPLTILDTPAWRATDFIARALWIELRRKLRNDGLNNGKIWLSCRDAAEKIGGNKDTIARRYAELEHYGFLRKTTEGFLGVDGCGIAPHYRFTDLAHGTHPATRDYEKWDGSIFKNPPRKSGWKKQNPVLRRRTPRIARSDIRKTPNGRSVCIAPSDIDEAPRCIAPSDVSRLPLPPARAAPMKQGSSTARAPACAGEAGSSPAPDVRPATTEKQPDAVADVPDQAEKAPPAQPDQPVSAPDPAPARPMLPGDARRAEIRARNQEAVQRFDAKMKERVH